MPRWDEARTVDSTLMFVTSDTGNSCASNALIIASLNVILNSSLLMSSTVTFDTDNEVENVTIVLVPRIGANVGDSVGTAVLGATVGIAVDGVAVLGVIVGFAVDGVAELGVKDGLLVEGTTVGFAVDGFAVGLAVVGLTVGFLVVGFEVGL